MQIKISQLNHHLEQQASGIYLISGDEPLIKQEARDSILKVARKNGFLSHEKIVIENRTNWQQFNELSKNQDLFCSKRIIELINPEAKFDTQATQILIEQVEKLTNDTLLLIISGRLNATQTRSNWYQSIEKKGVCLQVWPFNPSELKAWLQQRVVQAGLKANPNALQLLTELCENNLLAMQQAIEKIKLLYADQTVITAEHVLSAISDHSRYTIFDFINYVLQGQIPRLLHVLNILRQQGTEPSLLLWALAKETRNLLDLTEQQEQGQNIQKLIEREIFSKRPYLQAALRRLKSHSLKKLLAQLTLIDQSIKGINDHNVWLELSQLSLELARK